MEPGLATRVEHHLHKFVASPVLRSIGRLDWEALNAGCFNDFAPSAEDCRFDCRVVVLVKTVMVKDPFFHY